MRVKLLILNKYAESIEAFEKKARALIHQSPNAVVGLHVFEHPHNGTIAFLIQFAGRKKEAQDICILGWTQLDQVEALVNSTLEGMTANRMQGRHINIVATTKSQRALAALIVERTEADSPSEVSEGKENPASTGAKEQDAYRATQSNPRRQRQTVPRN